LDYDRNYNDQILLYFLLLAFSSLVLVFYENWSQSVQISRQEVLYSDGLAHFEQMQALFFASSGTRSRSAAEKVAAIHQQDSGGFPVALEIS
jgi:hypothetical protein